MSRPEHWPRRLEEAVEAASVTPFEWGLHDCCMKAADMVAAITGGADIAHGLRGTYDSMETALEILRQHGGLERLVTTRCAEFGWVRSKPSLARRGDLMLLVVPGAPMPALGVCVGVVAVFPKVGAAGLSYVPVSACKTSWRVE